MFLERKKGYLGLSSFIARYPSTAKSAVCLTHSGSIFGISIPFPHEIYFLMRRLLSLALVFCLCYSPLQAQIDDTQRSMVERQRIYIDCGFYKNRTYKVNDALNVENPNSFNALLSSYAWKDGEPLEQRLELSKYFEDKDKPLKIEARSSVSDGLFDDMRVYSVYYFLYPEGFLLVEQSYHLQQMDQMNEAESGWILFDLEEGDVKIMVVNGEEKDVTALSPQNQKVAELTYAGAMLFKDLR